MTIRQEFICDRKGCPSKAVAEELPKGWGGFDALGTKSRFCSIQCAQKFVAEWAKNHEIVSAALGGATVGTVFTCDQCEKEILLMPGDEWPTWVEMKREEQGAARVGFCPNSCLVLWVGHYADAHFTDTLSKKFLSEHAVKL